MGAGAVTASSRRGMGELEAQVLAVLWDAGDWMTPRAVLERLPPTPPVVYATVMTILRRLWQKGVLERRREGKAYSYHPVQGREELAADRMVALLEAATDSEVALSHFVSSLSAKQRRQIHQLLEGGSS